MFAANTGTMRRPLRPTDTWRQLSPLSMQCSPLSLFAVMKLFVCRVFFNLILCDSTTGSRISVAYRSEIYTGIL